MVGGFIFDRSTVMKKYLDESAISLYIHNKRQSLRGMPNLVAYRNGFTTDVAMTTGKEKFAKVFLLYLFFMKKDDQYCIVLKMQTGVLVWSILTLIIIR